MDQTITDLKASYLSTPVLSIESNGMKLDGRVFPQPMDEIGIVRLPDIEIINRGHGPANAVEVKMFCDSLFLSYIFYPVEQKILSAHRAGWLGQVVFQFEKLFPGSDRRLPEINLHTNEPDGQAEVLPKKEVWVLVEAYCESGSVTAKFRVIAKGNR